MWRDTTRFADGDDGVEVVAVDFTRNLPGAFESCCRFQFVGVVYILEAFVVASSRGGAGG